MHVDQNYRKLAQLISLWVLVSGKNNVLTGTSPTLLSGIYFCDRPASAELINNSCLKVFSQPAACLAAVGCCRPWLWYHCRPVQHRSDSAVYYRTNIAPRKSVCLEADRAVVSFGVHEQLQALGISCSAAWPAVTRTLSFSPDVAVLDTHQAEPLKDLSWKAIVLETRAVAKVSDLISDQLFIVCSKASCMALVCEKPHFYWRAPKAVCACVWMLECESVKSNLNKNAAVNPVGRRCNFTFMALT